MAFPLGIAAPQIFYCHRCKVGFHTPFEYWRHINSSINHHLCGICQYVLDFDSFTDLQTHLEEYHFYCEPCKWFAPSEIGLWQHNCARHSMCVTCGDYFLNLHQVTVHGFVHRPNAVSCYGCPIQFPVLSALYGHLESSRCASGVTSEDVKNIAIEYVCRLPDSPDRTFYCVDCSRNFNQMCDLLQHCETRSCRAGYWGGTGRVGQLAEYVKSRLLDLVNSRKQEEKNDNDDDDDDATIIQPLYGNEDVDSTHQAEIGSDIPRIVISGPPSDT